MTRYPGTDPPDTVRRRRDIGTQPYDVRPVERRQLFMDDGIDPAAFTDIVMQDVGAEAADLQSLIAVMNPTQLATSLQHMALQYRDMQNAATGTWDTDEDDDRVSGRGQPHGQRPAPSGSPPGRAHGRNAPEPTRDDKEEYALTPDTRAHRHPSIQDDRSHPAWHTATAANMAGTDDPTRDSTATRSAPTATQQPISQPAGTRGAEVVMEEPTRENSRQQLKLLNCQLLNWKLLRNKGPPSRHSWPNSKARHLFRLE